MKTRNCIIQRIGKYPPVISAVISALIFFLGAQAAVADTGDKIYVALGGDSGVAVVDPVTLDAWGNIKTGNITCRLRLSPDKKIVYATVNGDAKVDCIDVAMDKVIEEIKDVPGSYLIEPTPDGKRLLVSKEEGLSILDTKSYEEIGRFNLGDKIQAMKITPDGAWAYVVVGELNSVLVALDIKGMKAGQSIQLPSEVYDMDISPDGKTLYVCSVGERKIVVVDAAKMKITDEIDAYGDFGLAVSKDGSELWIPGPENAITVYSLKEKKAVAKAPLPQGEGLRRAVFSPDGKLLFALAVGEGSRLIYVFDAASRQKTGEIKLDNIPRDLLYIQK